MRGVQFAVCAAILGTALPATVLAQSPDPCKDLRAQQAWDAGMSPVYADASELADSLRDHGFVVECIRRSKWETLFMGQKGAAFYKTDRGAFDVWFLPKTQTFAALRIIEQPEPNGRYAYSFRGNPHIPSKIDSRTRIWFIKHGNVLFAVFGDQELAAAIENAFQAR